LFLPGRRGGTSISVPPDRFPPKEVGGGAARSEKSPAFSHLPIGGGPVFFPVLMNFTDFLLLAQAAAPAPGAPEQPPFFMSIMPLIFVFVIFYFLLIRPQQKKQKEHQKLVESVKTGDKVVTSAGIHGIIANVKDRTVVVKVADNVKIEFDRVAITMVEKGSDAAEAK
jgi:preprotein translocase subunit YajC